MNLDFKSGHGLVGLSAPRTEALIELNDSSAPMSSALQSSDASHIVNGSLNGGISDSVNGDGPTSRPFPSLVEERIDNISDNMSYMSLEVNTTGTGSIRVGHTL